MKRLVKGGHPDAPTWYSDRFRLMQPFLTDRVIELAHRRIFMGEKFFSGETLLVPDGLETVKAALLVAYEINPLEDFQDLEEALMRGISRKTLSARRKAKEVKSL